MLPWVAQLEDKWDSIGAEALNLSSGFSRYDYPGVGVDGWNSFKFVSRGRVFEENCARCPIMWWLLKQIPHYPQFRDAMFSVIDSYVAIGSHQDSPNVYLTCHLGLRILEDSGLRVVGLVLKWAVGKCVVFASSFVHEVWNNGDLPRLLLTDFLHPEITNVEASFLTQSTPAQ